MHLLFGFLELQQILENKGGPTEGQKVIYHKPMNFGHLRHGNLDWTCMGPE